MAVLLKSHAPHFYICPFFSQKVLVLVNLSSLVLKRSPVVLSVSKLVRKGSHLSREDESRAVCFWKHADSRVVFFLRRELHSCLWFKAALK
jgi:hypothetical protein